MAHSKYSDAIFAVNNDEAVLDTPEHRIALYDARRCNGDGGASGGEGPVLSSLVERSTSEDPFWKPRAYRADLGWIWSRELIDATYPDGYVPNVRIAEHAWRTAELEAQMPAFRGVSPSPAELYRGQVFARA